MFQTSTVPPKISWLVKLMKCTGVHKGIRSVFHVFVYVCAGLNGTVYRLSYSELDAAANRLARALLGHLVHQEGRDAVVAVSLAPSDALLLTLLAVWKAGAAYLPLDNQAANRVQHILQEARPLLVITDEPQGIVEASRIKTSGNTNLSVDVS